MLRAVSHRTAAAACVRALSSYSPPKMVDAFADGSKRAVRVAFDDGSVANFAWAWLRDNSTDPNTFAISESTRARMLLMKQFDPQVEPTAVRVVEGQLEVDWPDSDGGTATFSSRWLTSRHIDDSEFRQHRQAFQRVEPVPWGRELIQTALPRVSWPDVMREEPTVLRDYLVGFMRYGVGLIDDVPCEEGQLHRLASVLGRIRNSHYGETFQVKQESVVTNLAYTNRHLGLHTDLPYELHPPQIQCLHVLRQSAAGGENEFADGFNTARQLQQQHPQAYELLSSVEQEYLDDGINQHRHIYCNTHPVFELNSEEEVSAVYFNNQQRSWFVDLPHDMIQQWYEALHLFNETCYEPTNLFELKLQEGQMVMFANNRVLHGRKSYVVDDTLAGNGPQRHLVGCYFTFDSVLSMIRVLNQALGKNTHAAFEL